MAMCIQAHNRRELSADEAMAKWWATELQKRVDAPVLSSRTAATAKMLNIARMYLDTRVQTIYGGTTEIMKEIKGVVRTLLLPG
ncbi:MAG: acyl-CoA dehydrogenase family protein [Kouleothrix sp.]